MGLFEKKTWLNRIAEYPNRRTITEDGTSKIVTVARNEGTVSQEGDAFNATNMNNLEKRIDEAITKATGDCEIYQEGGNFYIKKGTSTKKLGSSEGSATSEQVLAGATFNSAITPDSQDYSVGSMVDNQGKTLTGGSVTNSKTALTATIPQRGCYDTNSKISIPQTSVANVYYLGTGTSFDLKALFPNDYSKLTANNFLCVAKSVSVSANGKGGYEIHGGGYASDDHIQYTSGSKSSNISKSYSNGVLTIGGYGASCSDSNNVNSGSVSAYGEISASASISFEVYVVLGKITTI